MSKHMRNGLVVIGLLILVAPALAAPKKPAVTPPPAVSEADRAALAGPWKGAWTGAQYRYDAAMALNVDPAGSVEGAITWTLRATPSVDGKSRIGMSGVEYVHGRFYPDSETLVLEGYRKDDPYGIWELDKYRLAVSPTRTIMGGITDEHGSWAGEFFLTR
jgi:hypothetical protein